MKVRMKKRLSCITAAIMACLLSGILTAVPVQAASSDFVILNYTNISDTSIVKGDAFTVDVSYQNVSGSTLNNVSVTIDSTCSFYGSSSNTVEAYNPDSGGIRTKTLALIYKGTGNELMLVYSYTKGGVDYSTSQSVFISGCTATTTDTTTIDTTKYTASLGVVAETEIPVLTAGKSNTLKLPILNSGNYAAKDLSILMEQSDTSKGSIIEKINLTQFILLIKPDESQTASFTFNVPGDAPSGIQVMKLTYKYVNTYGDALTASEFIQVKVVNTSTPPRLSVFNTTTFADPQESGVIVLNIGVRNMGTRAAEDVKVTLKGLKNGGFTTFNSTDVKYVAEIKGGSDSGINYRLS
ncbi:MAG: hypothetical protein HGA22_13230, partial [Clostridiales bacterium]|nr:hypothetical protein [Clostridiales bacterium]